ncbi:unnamed protein product [Spodoptera exigua]|nr:unnamed protein product [Spodoptera exigua]
MWSCPVGGAVMSRARAWASPASSKLLTARGRVQWLAPLGAALEPGQARRAASCQRRVVESGVGGVSTSRPDAGGRETHAASDGSVGATRSRGRPRPSGGRRWYGASSRRKRKRLPSFSRSTPWPRLRLDPRPPPYTPPSPSGGLLNVTGPKTGALPFYPKPDIFVSGKRLRQAVESGRFVPSRRIDRTYISDLSRIAVQGKCVAMYRLNSNAVDARNVADVRYLA